MTRPRGLTELADTIGGVVHLRARTEQGDVAFELQIAPRYYRTEWVARLQEMLDEIDPARPTLSVVNGDGPSVGRSRERSPRTRNVLSLLR